MMLPPRRAVSRGADPQNRAPVGRDGWFQAGSGRVNVQVMASSLAIMAAVCPRGHPYLSGFARGPGGPHRMGHDLGGQFPYRHVAALGPAHQASLYEQAHGAEHEPGALDPREVPGKGGPPRSACARTATPRPRYAATGALRPPRAHPARTCLGPQPSARATPTGQDTRVPPSLRYPFGFLVVRQAPLVVVLPAGAPELFGNCA